LPFPLPGQPEGVEPGAPGAAAAPFSAAGDVPGAGSEEVLDWAVCPMPHPPQPGHPPQPQQPQPQPPQPQPQPGIIIGRAPPIIIGFMPAIMGFIIICIIGFIIIAIIGFMGLESLSSLSSSFSLSSWSEAACCKYFSDHFSS